MSFIAFERHILLNSLSPKNCCLCANIQMYLCANIRTCVRISTSYIFWDIMHDKIKKIYIYQPYITKNQSNQHYTKVIRISCTKYLDIFKKINFQYFVVGRGDILFKKKSFFEFFYYIQMCWYQKKILVEISSKKLLLNYECLKILRLRTQFFGKIDLRRKLV